MKNLKKMVYMLILTLSLLMSNIIFAEVPHTTIVENPSKEVTKVETLKRKDKAELNLTVEKKKSKEVVGYIYIDKIKIFKEFNENMNFNDNYKLLDINGKEYKTLNLIKTEEGLEIECKEIPDYIYLVGEKETWIWINRPVELLEHKKGLTIQFTDDYNGEMMTILHNGKYNGGFHGHAWLKFPVEGIISFEGEASSKLPSGYTIKNFSVGGYGVSGYNPPSGKNEYPVFTAKLTDDITIKTGNYIENGWHYLQVGFEKIPPRDFDFAFWYRIGSNSRYAGMEYSQHFHFRYVVTTLKGTSTLTVREKYPTNEYINFDFTTTKEGKPLALKNPIPTNVSLSATGKGLVEMLEGDILEIDGKQVKIGTGGNLGVQEATIGNLKYSYKVEAGRLSIALHEWGVLEPNHNLKITIIRGNSKKAEHNLIIDSPRRVEGTNNIKIDNNYQIRNVIKFNGISLDTPSSFALESPIPAGITLAEQTGYGIPLLDEGDTIQIDDGRTRTVHSYTIQSGGSLPSQRVEFSNGSIDLQVVNRKVQVRLNNWKVNEPMRLNLRAIRGVNEISNHEITLTAPEAPFNMLETGNLDFGNVLQGAKNKKAESNIRIEMLAGQDVSEVKFNLREEQPIMTNSQGTELKVKSINRAVQKVRDREYNIKLRGTLDVPEEQQSGEYRGSNILDIEVK